MSITAAVNGQLDAVCKQWRTAIERLPAEHWRSGDVAYLTPARLAVHVIAATDFYTRDEQPTTAASLLEARFGRPIIWAETSAAQLPDQRETLAYLDDIRDRAARWLNEMDDARWLELQKQFLWTGPNLLSRMIYAIRHGQDHMGELNAELRRRGLERAKWEM